MAEIFKGFENNLRIMRGFYVTKMKKDPRTGQYIGVATWIPRDETLPGTRTKSESDWSSKGQSPKLNVRSDSPSAKIREPTETASVSQPQPSGDSTTIAHDREQSEREYQAGPNADFSRLTEDQEARKDDQIRKKSNYYDPYESYDL